MKKLILKKISMGLATFASCASLSTAYAGHHSSCDHHSHHSRHRSSCNHHSHHNHHHSNCNHHSHHSHQDSCCNHSHGESDRIEQGRKEICALLNDPLGLALLNSGILWTDQFLDFFTIFINGAISTPFFNSANEGLAIYFDHLNADSQAIAKVLGKFNSPSDVVTMVELINLFDVAAVNYGTGVVTGNPTEVALLFKQWEQAGLNLVNFFSSLNPLIDPNQLERLFEVYISSIIGMESSFLEENFTTQINFRNLARDAAFQIGAYLKQHNW